VLGALENTGASSLEVVLAADAAARRAAHAVIDRLPVPA
jgi:1-deoxy-D-xylulose-5-phosphate reductoisomerase